MHKAGYVNIIGHPNVGKSTLMNALLGEQLSIATPKAQTTRHRILGIYNEEEMQIVFSDTPGVLEPAYALQSNMMDYVNSAFEDADVLLYLVEAEDKPLRNEGLFRQLEATNTPVLLLINKIDLLDQPALESAVEKWHGLLPKAEILPISALNKFTLQPLLERLRELIPESPPYFDKEDLSDRNERFFAAEMIREQILIHYKKEVPYSVEVVVESFKEAEDIIRIQSVIFVERDTQKGILIGHQGKMIKRVGIGARQKMESFFKKKVHLEIFVKVQKDWRSNEQQLKRFGY